MSEFQFYDFFAGVGLAELGLAESGWSCVWANDIDPGKRSIYVQNFDPAQYHLGDVNDVQAYNLPLPVDMAWASFPCQDLSLAGWRRGLDARRSGAFWAFHRIMAELHERGCRPPLIVIENVVGLLHGKDFAGLCEALADLDMQFGAVVIDAKHFVPQSRPRVFVIAVDRSVDASAFASVWPTALPWAPKAIHRAKSTLSPRCKELWRWWTLPSELPSVGAVSDLIEDQPTDVKWNSDEQTQYLLSLMSETNIAKVRMAQQSGIRHVGFLYRRTREGKQRAEVRFDGIAGCLRTTYGGSSRQTVVTVEGDWIRSRLLSPREAARLMGVPDSFSLEGKYNDTYRAMGDGVAVPAVKWLSDNLLTPLAHASNSPKYTRNGQLSMAAVQW